MAEVTGIPRWLELQAEIDYRIFLLNEMRRELQAEDERLSPLDRLIDEATGLDEARLAEAEEIIAEIKVLKAEWDALASGEEDVQRSTGELCGCRCKNPKGKCGCCDESLVDWYASMEDDASSDKDGG
jgi:hypothetical protein